VSCLTFAFWLDSKAGNFDRAVLDVLKIVTALLGCKHCWQYATFIKLHMKTCMQCCMQVPPPVLYSGCAISKSSCLRSPAYNSHVCFVALDCIAQAHVESSLNHGVIPAAFEVRTHQPQCLTISAEDVMTLPCKLWQLQNDMFCWSCEMECPVHLCIICRRSAKKLTAAALCIPPAPGRAVA